MAKLKTGRHTSALKSHRQSLKHRWANLAAKEKAKKLTKQLVDAIAQKDAGQAKELLPQVVSVWTRIGRRNVVNHSTASRKISRLSRSVHRILAVPR